MIENDRNLENIDDFSLTFHGSTQGFSTLGLVKAILTMEYMKI